MKNIRQGDVFLKKVSKLPTGLKKKDNILAYGEVTGHKHQVVGKAIVLTDGTTQYVDVQSEAELIHEEHQKHLLQKGAYKVILQREVNLLGEVKKVMD